LTQKIVSM